MFWTMVDPDGRTYVVSVDTIKAVAREQNWIAVYFKDGEMTRFEYLNADLAEKVLQSFRQLVGA